MVIFLFLIWLKWFDDVFKDELDAFIERIEIRAEQKIEEQMVEAQKEAQREEELDKEARLGPGGLDPVEVFESLPDVSTYRISANSLRSIV